jgi:hypothetical protein
MWQSYENGKTLNTQGTESGKIIRDEEFSDGARITLEKEGYAPFAITCGVYSLMFHTTYASTETEANVKYAGMKSEIERLFDEDAEPLAWCEKFVEIFP